jgi:hypothetical protein
MNACPWYAFVWLQRKIQDGESNWQGSPGASIAVSRAISCWSKSPRLVMGQPPMRLKASRRNARLAWNLPVASSQTIRISPCARPARGLNFSGNERKRREMLMLLQPSLVSFFSSPVRHTFSGRARALRLCITRVLTGRLAPYRYNRRSRLARIDEE